MDASRPIDLRSPATVSVLHKFSELEIIAIAILELLSIEVFLIS